jgi:hypothetical protein
MNNCQFGRRALGYILIIIQEYLFGKLEFKMAAIPNLELDGASRKLRTLVIAKLSYESTNLMSGEPLGNFREAYMWNCCQNGP